MIFDLISSGLVLTSVYYLISFSISFQYGVGGFPNLALCYIGQLGVYVTTSLWDKLGVSLSIIIGIFTSALLGLIFQKIVINPLAKGRNENEKRLYFLFGTFATLVALPPIYKNLFTSIMVSVQIPSGPRLFNFITTFELCIIVAAIAFFIVFRFFINKTLYGHMIQAVTENPKLSSIMRINVQGIYLVVASISAVIAYIGLLIWSKLYVVRLETGSEMVIYGFIVSVLGGLGNITGALIAAIIVGFANAITSFLIGGVYAPLIVFIVFAITILIFPRGILRSERTL